MKTNYHSCIYCKDILNVIYFCLLFHVVHLYVVNIVDAASFSSGIAEVQYSKLVFKNYIGGCLQKTY